MAGGGLSTTTGGAKNYPGKLTFKVFLTCIIAASGGLIFGYDLGVSGGVTSMDSFLKKFFPDVYEKESSIKPSDNQYCKFNSQKLTLFTSSLYLAALLSSVTASALTRALGRRATMMASGALFGVGALFNGFAQKLWMLIVGRLLLGFGIGCANQAVPIYVSEMAPSKYRGFLNIFFQLAITIGILAASLLNYFFQKSIEGDLAWRLSLGAAVVPAIIIFFGSLILSDTPNSLLERGLPEDAKNLLKTIRGVDSVDMEFNDLVAAVEKSNSVKSPWVSLFFKRKYKPQLTFAFFIPFFQQFTGMNVFIFYAPVLFKTIGFGSSAALMSTVITNGVNACATLLSIVTVDKMGRRVLFIEGGIQMLVCQVIMTAAIAVKFGVTGNPGVMPEWYATMIVAAMCVYIAAFAWSWGPLGWLVPSEIFPLEVRSAAQAINVSVNMFFTFVVAQVFTWLLCHLRFGLFIFFACFVVIMTVFIIKLLPETKGVPIEEMAVVWKNHPFWRNYVVEDQQDINDDDQDKKTATV